MPEIGATLREARMRAHIDLSEIEAKTKIRARYLRALENEEWDVLPGPTFTKSFLRTYAEALDLDAKTLIEEYRLQNEQPGEAELQPIVSTPRRTRPGRSESAGGDLRGPSRGYAIAIGAIAIVILLLIVGLLTHKSGKGPNTRKQQNVATGHHHHSQRHRAGTKAANSGHHPTRTASRPGEATIVLQATETVWICLIGEGERKLIPGIELHAGESSGPYHAKRFQMTLGNNDLTMTVNGRELPIPASTEAIGYEITSAGRQTLPAGSEPTCA